MTAAKLFFIVFVAVFLGNLATLGSIQVFMKRQPETVTDFLKELNESHPASIGVSFKNKSGNRMNCGLFDEKNDYVNFLNLLGNEEKHFENFVYGSKMRCSIQIDNRSSTMLTYFEVKAAGDYSFSLDKVPCSSCKGQDWRWATVFVDPQGRSDYTPFQ